jgi:hypothetical protein
VVADSTLELWDYSLAGAVVSGFSIVASLVVAAAKGHYRLQRLESQKLDQLALDHIARRAVTCDTPMAPVSDGPDVSSVYSCKDDASRPLPSIPSHCPGLP